MQCKGAYHALANDEQCFLRCESLEAPMSQMGQGPKVSPGANLVCTTPDSRHRFQPEDFSVGPIAESVA
jgi:hypothetical protein